MNLDIITDAYDSEMCEFGHIQRMSLSSFSGTSVLNQVTLDAVEWLINLSILL